MVQGLMLIDQWTKHRGQAPHKNQQLQALTCFWTLIFKKDWKIVCNIYIYIYIYITNDIYKYITTTTTATTNIYI